MPRTDLRRPDIGARLRERLEQLDAANRRRATEPALDPQGVERRIGDERLLSFNSNDYLGLAGHPALRDALIAGARRWGVGSGASHLVSGHTAAHRALEEELADWLGRESALLFSTGYMANLGLARTLLERGDLAVCDRLAHASILDAVTGAGARLARYPHADAAAAEARLARRPDRAAVLMTDGLFSMDGDLAPLDALADAAHRHGAWLCVDDAHGLGVTGATGRGALEHFGLGADRVPALVGTLGKAFGGFGAFVAGDRALVEALVQSARSYIYTTAPPAAVAEAGRAALRLVIAESWRRDRLSALVRRFREGVRSLGLNLYNARSVIQPLLVGDDRDALALSRALRHDGIWVPAIRPPTVPHGSARLRITFSAAHNEKHVDRLLDALDRHIDSDTIRRNETSTCM